MVPRPYVCDSGIKHGLRFKGAAFAREDPDLHGSVVVNAMSSMCTCNLQLHE